MTAVKLLKYEFTKHFNKFTILFILSMFLLNLAVAAYQYADAFSQDSHSFREAKNQLLIDYIHNREQFDLEYTDYTERYKNYESTLRLWAMSDDFKQAPVFENKMIDLGGYGDRRLFGEVTAVIERSADYKNDIIKLLRGSYQKIEEIGTQNHTYVYDYQVNVILRYEKLTELEIKPAETYGWNEYFSLNTPLVFLLITSLGFFCGIFTSEKRAGIANIHRISKNGGIALIRAKIFFIGISSVLLTLVFTLSPLIVFMLSTGLSGTDRFIHSLDAFEYCPYAFTVFQYVFVYLAVRILVFLCFDGIAAVIGQYFGNELPVFGFSALFIAINYGLYSQEYTSPLYNLKKFSFFETGNVNILFDRYRAINILGFCADFLLFTLIVMAVLLIITLTLALTRKSIRGMLQKNEGGRGIGFNTLKLSILSFEFDKNLLNKGGLLIFTAAIAVKIVISGVYYKPMTTEAEDIYISYINDVAGEVTGEKMKYIEEEKEYIERSVSEYQTASEDYRNGKISAEEYRTYANRNNYANANSEPFRKLHERGSYLQSISENHENIMFIYEYGAKKLLFSEFDVTAVLFGILIFSNVFANEYQSRFSAILRMSKNGRYKTFKEKILFTFITSIVVFILFSAIDIAFMNTYFKMNYLSANIMSIPEYAYLDTNLSIFGYIFIFKIISCMGFLFFALMITGLSQILKNQVKTVIAGSFIILVPFLLDYYGIGALGFINMTDFFAPVYADKNIAAYIFCTVLTLVIYLKTRFAWSKE